VALAVISILGIVYFFTPAIHAKYWKYYLLTGWFWGMLLPEMATAEGIPHGLRSAGAIAPTFIIAAVGLYGLVQIFMKLHNKLWEHVLYRWKDPQWMKDHHYVPWRKRLVDNAFKFLAVCFFLALIFQTYLLYFVYASSSAEYFYAFRADLTTVSQYLVQHCENSLAEGKGSTKQSTFLVLDTYSEQTPDYLTSDPKGNFSQPCNVPYMVQDPASSWQLPPLKPGEQVVFTQSTIYDTHKFAANHPEAYLLQQDMNQFGATVMAVYQAKVQ